MCQPAVDLPAILALAWAARYETLFLIALACYGISILLDSRRKDLARLASEFGLEFAPRATLEQIGLLGTTFEGGLPAENCLRGMIAGRETIVFDLRMRQLSLDGFREKSGYSGITAIIVGFRVPADCYCRSRDIPSARIVARGENGRVGLRD